MSAAVVKPQWMKLWHEPDAHMLVPDPSARGWRALCQDNDLPSLIEREARDGGSGDSFCRGCRRVLVMRLRLAIAKRRRHAGQVA